MDKPPELENRLIKFAIRIINVVEALQSSLRSVVPALTSQINNHQSTLASLK